MNKIPPSLLKSPGHFLAFGMGTGLSPYAPGTAGTLMAVVWYLGLRELSNWHYLFVVLVAFILGIWLCEQASKALGVHDHGGIVWDEFVGFWIAMIAAPEGWFWVIVGFALFRLFDIWKPYPIKLLDQRVHGGLGIMLDDVLAGLYALIVIQLLNMIM